MNVRSADRGRPRLAGSDAIRVVAVVGVVMIHASAWAPSREQDFAALNLASRFSVPVFMVLTGVVLGYQYLERPLGAGFVRRRAARTVVPWLIWMPLYVLFDVFVISSVRQTPASVYTWVNQGAGHLWYLLLIPQLYILFAVWPRRRAWLLVGPAFALQTALCVLRVYGPLPSDLLQQIVLLHGHLLFPFWIGYFALGVAAGRSIRPGANIPHRRILAAAAAIAAMGSGYLLLNITFAGAQYRDSLRGTGAFLNPVLPLFALSVAGLALLTLPPLLRRVAALGRACRELSDLSLGVYIIHPVPLFWLGIWLRPYISQPTPFSFLPFCAIVVLAIAGGAVATRLIAATPLAVAVGMRQRSMTIGRPLSARGDAAPAG